MATNERETEPEAEPTPAAPGSWRPRLVRALSWRRPRWSASLRRLAPGLAVVALLALPTGLVVHETMAGTQPASSPGSGGRGELGDGDDGGELDGGEAVAIDDFLDPDLLDAVPVGPDDVAEPVRAVLTGARVIDALDDSDIPAVARDAYDLAEVSLGEEDPACNMTWSVLAAIGRVESDHGRFGGTRLTENGDGTMKILGIPLDGRPNIALIRDTDGGELDDDTTFDRAVGPMQIIPSTWRPIASDGNDDGRRDPNNIYDAARGAARYLCAGNDDLEDMNGRARAIRRYNNADEYVRLVLNLATMYETGDLTVVEDSIARQTGFDEDLIDIGPPLVLDPGPAAPPPPPARAAAPAPPPPPPPPPAAAVGWAPAMREVVVEIITEPPPPPPSTTATTSPTSPPGPACTPATTAPAPPSTTGRAPAGPATTTTARPPAATTPACPPATTPPPAGNAPTTRAPTSTTAAR